MESRGLAEVEARPTVGDLRHARDLLLGFGHGSARCVARAIDQILNGGDARLALGLKGKAGQRSAFTTERLHQRDCLIRQMASRHFPNQSVSDQARQIIAAASTYWRRAARLDCELIEMPGSYVDTPREQLYQLVRLPMEMPGERTIRAILSDRAETTSDTS